HDVFTRPASRFVAEFLGFENFLHGTVTRIHGESITVHSPSWGGELGATPSSDHDVAIGDAVQVAIRSGSLRVEATDAHGGSYSTRATVTDINYLGDGY